MRLTDFWERMDLALGPSYARSWAQDVVLPNLGVTVNQALLAGIETKVIWRAVCQAADVPDAIA